MTTTDPGIVLRHLREFAAAEGSRSAPDRQLLQRFADGRDDAAFAALVRRHGPLVLGVCRRVLHNAHDAEDAFQATFLVLSQKAGRIDPQRPLGGWLYQVAYNMAVNVCKQAATRRKREARSTQGETSDPLAEVSGRELLAILDAELQALPGCERLALVLCYLQGKTHDEAAREVGCSLSTLKRRLERGKERMRLRLARRGVALSAAFLAAGLAQGASVSVPALLTTDTIKAGVLTVNGQAIAGVVRAQAAALAAGTMHTTLSGKLKAVGALLVAVVLMGIGAGLFASSPPAAAEKVEPKPLPVAAPVKPAEDRDEMTVSGRVLDADGKALSGAEIVVMAWTKVAHRGGDLSSHKAKQLGRDKTDTEGRFHLKVPRTSSERFPLVAAITGGAGHGVGWKQLKPDDQNPTAEIRLTREQVIRGRFVDVQGAPAVGITVGVGTVTVGQSDGIGLLTAGEEPSCWPKAAVTDKDGRFEIHGVGKGAGVRLAVGDDRFARQEFALMADGKEVLRSLEPAHIIEGTITYADTGKPIPAARLTIYAGKSELDSMFGTEGKADDRGRFRLNPTPGNFFRISAYAPDGKPYLTVQKSLTWPKAAVKQQMDFALPRGVLVRGKLTEAGSERAVRQATVQFIPRRSDNPNFRADALTGWQNTVVSGADGRFDICVLPGPGHLLIHGPTHDYLLKEIGDAKLQQGKKGGTRFYAHAIIPLDLKPGTETHDTTATLKRAVTVKGRVLDVDGKPVAEALMVSRLNIDPLVLFWRGFPTLVRDGRFELHGCDPEKSYPVFFLNGERKIGATVKLSGKQAGEEVTVRLMPCGSATTRLLDADGKPIAKANLWLEQVVTPGAARYDFKRLYEQGELAADADFVANIDRGNYQEAPLTDAEGRITFPVLIPGATYRIVEIGDRDDMIKCEFKAESGKTIKLPDVVRKK